MKDPGPLPVYGRTDSVQVKQDVNNEFHENKRIYEKSLQHGPGSQGTHCRRWTRFTSMKIMAGTPNS